VTGQGAHDFDVVIVGASIAGCSAATLYARRGLKVGLLERRPDMDAYKVVCSHYIQACATPMLQRHGFGDAIEAEGGVRNRAHLWTRYGWIRPQGVAAQGYTLRRERLDPMLRRIAADTPGVELMLGHTASDVTWRDGRVTGVEVAERDGTRRTIRARLVVAADGRDTKVARMARVPGRILPHGRFVYWAYVRGLPRREDGAATAWFLDPDIALINPCDDDLTCVITSPVKSRLPEFKRDLESAWLRFVEELPDGPPIREVERVTRFVGKIDTPNVQRPAAKNGVAFIGDAALASDPVWAIGCGWAFESSEWLTDATADLLADGRDVEPGLDRYRRRHRSELTAHHLIRSYYATGRPFNTAERIMYAAAARDEKLADQVHEFVTREGPVRRFVGPRTYARAIRVLATARPRVLPLSRAEVSSTRNGAPQRPATSSGTNGSSLASETAGQRDSETDAVTPSRGHAVRSS
jgi:2-polyprenyl-6-methoxyphenol hydroxylase-like FAD-dependent oxidoreductase